MAAPDYVPPLTADQPRASLPLPPPRRWTANRPADLRRGQPDGWGMGAPGPDQGYALNLARLFEPRLRLAPGEHAEDVTAGCVAVALKRASGFGRAPVSHDLEVAFGMFGFLDDAPADLVECRRGLFRGAGHDYWQRQAVVERVPDATLRLSPAEVRGRLADWRALTGAGGSGPPGAAG